MKTPCGVAIAVIVLALVVGSYGAIGAVAADTYPAEATMVYWNSSGGAIARSNLDGTGVENLISDYVHGVAVDPVHGRVYWNNPVMNTLRWAALDGTDIETIATGVGTGDIALDLVNAKVYWNSSGGAIARSNLDGTGVENLVSDYVAGVGVDPLHGRVYWNNPVMNTLRWAALDGTDIHTIATGVGTGHIALDLVNAKVYWNSSGGYIARSNLDGTDVENLISDYVHGVAVDPVHGRVYWNNPVMNTLRWAALDGTDIETIATGVGTGAMSLDTAYVPEPTSLFLLVLGVLGTLVHRRRK